MALAEILAGCCPFLRSNNLSANDSDEEPLVPESYNSGNNIVADNRNQYLDPNNNHIEDSETDDDEELEEDQEVRPACVVDLSRKLVNITQKSHDIGDRENSKQKRQQYLS